MRQAGGGEERVVAVSRSERVVPRRCARSPRAAPRRDELPRSLEVVKDVCFVGCL